MNKILYQKTKLDWFKINTGVLNSILSSLSITVYNLDEKEIIKVSLEKSDKNFNIQEIYKGQKLYDLTIYSICNDLIIFKDELDFVCHKETILKWYSLAKNYLDYLEKIFIENKFSLVVAVNGHTLMDACLLVLAKKYDYPFLCLENTSHKKKIVWDDETGKVVTYNLAKKYFHKFLNKIDNAQASKYAAKFKETIFSNKKMQHLSNADNNEIPFETPFVLFIGQVYSDAAQLFAIQKGYNNPIEVIESVVNTCANYNLPLVIKLHPKESNGGSPVGIMYNMPTFKRIKKLQSSKVKVDYENIYNTYNLIQNSHIIITLNSQAGLEACLYDKPVLSYYNAFYSGLGFTFDYYNKESFNRHLEDILENNIQTNKNLDLAQKFFFIFFEKYCFNNSVDELVNRLLRSGKFDINIHLKISLNRLKKGLKRKFNLLRLNFYND